jgi:hypothetical protein
MRRAAPTLWILAFLAIFAGGTLLFALLWLPIWLRPFAWTLQRTAPAGLVLALIPLPYGRRRAGEGERLSRASRFVLRPPGWPLVVAGSLVVALLGTGAQVLLLRRNPYLTLAQYWREEIWALWLFMLPAAALMVGGHALWVRLRTGTPAPAPPAAEEPPRLEAD